MFLKICTTDWQIRRILQFAYFLEKKAVATSVKAVENLGKVGVLCSWFSKQAHLAFLLLTQHHHMHSVSLATTFVLCLAAVLKRLRVLQLKSFTA